MGRSSFNGKVYSSTHSTRSTRRATPQELANFDTAERRTQAYNRNAVNRSFAAAQQADENATLSAASKVLRAEIKRGNANRGVRELE